MRNASTLTLVAGLLFFVPAFSGCDGSSEALDATTPEASAQAPEVGETLLAKSGALQGDPCTPPTSAIVITELMIDPYAVSDANGEWIEVHNPGGTAVDLKNWKIKDLGTDTHTIASSVVVQPGGYAVLCRVSDPGTNGGVTCAYQYGSSFQLGNSGDEVLLENASGTEVDRLVYTGTAPSGKAIGLRHPFLDNVTLTIPSNPGSASSWTGSNFSISLTDFGAGGDKGTPGAKNADIWSEQEFAGCSDNNLCTFDLCEAGKCNNVYKSGCCVSAADCNDGDICTKDECNTQTNKCKATPIAGCCKQNSDCVDDNPCNQDYCLNNVCRFSYYNVVANCCWAPADKNPNTGQPWEEGERQAYADAQCTMKNPCYTYSCDLTAETCKGTKLPNCCLENTDCDDKNLCTFDLCQNNKCYNNALSNCCTADSACDDGDACTEDKCLFNQCRHLLKLDGVCCSQKADCPDDGDKCTAEDCVGGQCVRTQIQDCKRDLPYVEDFDKSPGLDKSGWKVKDYGTYAADHWGLGTSAEESLGPDKYAWFNFYPTTLGVKTVLYTPPINAVTSAQDSFNTFQTTTVQWRMWYHHSQPNGEVKLRVVATDTLDFPNGADLYTISTKADIPFGLYSAELPLSLKFSGNLRIGFLLETSSTFNLDSWQIDDVKVAAGRANALVKSRLYECNREGNTCEPGASGVKLIRETQGGIADMMLGVNRWYRLVLCYQDDDQAWLTYFGNPAVTPAGAPLQTPSFVKPVNPSGAYIGGCWRLISYSANQYCNAKMERGAICTVDIDPKGQDANVGTWESGIIGWDELEPTKAQHSPFETLTRFKLTVNLESGYIVWSPLDPAAPAALALKASLEENGRKAQIVTDILALSDNDLSKLYSGVFAVLGVHGNMHVVTDAEAAKLKTYLDGGGRLYLEGGDFFYTGAGATQSETVLHPYFKIEGKADGAPKLDGPLSGKNFLNGFGFNVDQGATYNVSLDRLAHVAQGGGREVMRNEGSKTFATTVTYDSGKYRTIGTSVPFGALLAKGAGTPKTLMQQYLAFLEGGYPQCGSSAECEDYEVCTTDTCDLTGTKKCKNELIPGCTPCADDLDCGANQGCKVSVGYCGDIPGTKFAGTTELPKTFGASPSTFTNTVSVSGHGIATDVQVKVQMTHSYRGDVELKLTHGGKTVVLKASNPADAGKNINATYDLGVPVAQGSDLAAFDGEQVNGDWVLTVTDSDPSMNNGVLEGWSLYLKYDPTCGSNADCDDNNPCTTDTCDVVAGACAHVIKADGASCNFDSDGCTNPDTCQNGVCTKGAAVTCPASQKQCYVNVCQSTGDASHDCVEQKSPSGTPCDDNNEGTVNDKCDGNGLCVGTPVNVGCQSDAECDDDNPCTIDDCNTVTGKCSYVNDDGKACNYDSNGCTKDDKCQGGVCTVGSAVTCAPSSKKCYETKCVSTGNNSYSCPETPQAANTPCNDDNDCTSGDKCNGSGLCVGTPIQGCCTKNSDCDDQNQCTTDTCNAGTGQCSYTKKGDGTACDFDSDGCTKDDACSNGVCVKGQTVTCPVNQKQCYENYCYSAGTNTYQCLERAKASGVPCDDGNAQTENDQCDGQGTCKGTKIGCKGPSDCVDGNVCTQDVCNLTTGECSHPAGNEGGACEADHNGCTSGDKCVSGVCSAGVFVTCPPNQKQCYENYCNSTGDTSYECKERPKANTAPCDDGDAGTINDKCNGQGLCVGTPIQTGCQSAADCDDNNACTVDICNQDGSCSHGNAQDGTMCNADNNGCTSGDRCVTGVCMPGTPVVCPADPNVCRINTCVSTSAITYECQIKPATKGTACDDGNLCTAQDNCNGSGACVGTQVIGCCRSDTDCNDNNPCTQDHCDVPTGTCATIVAANGTVCDADGKGCTQGDSCVDGVCKVGTPVTCPVNQSQCMENVCVSVGAFGYKCQEVPSASGKLCSDNNVCTSLDKCNGLGSCVGIPVLNCCQSSSDCDDKNPCTTDTCGTDNKCKYANVENGTACDRDGNGCTVGDTCTNGICVAGPPATCAQSPNQCLENVCQSVNPTNYICASIPRPVGYACNDGIGCTLSDACNGNGLCVGTSTGACCKSAADCNDNNPCTNDSCNTTTGICSNVPAADGSLCNADSNGCTVNDACKGGVCLPGSPACKSTTVCATKTCTSTGENSYTCNTINADITTPCDDGAWCTLNDHCNGQGSCVGGAPRDCTAAVGPCQERYCDEGLDRCMTRNRPDGLACDADNNGCTVGDVCLKGDCKPGLPADCSAQNATCKVGTCKNLGGAFYDCVGVALPAGTACSTGKFCLVDATCSENGVCGGAKIRDCTKEPSDGCKDYSNSVCDSGQDKCINVVARANGTPCDDGNPCSETDTCQNGVCTGSTPLICTEDRVSKTAAATRMPAIASVGFGRYVTQWTGSGAQQNYLRFSDDLGGRENEERQISDSGSAPQWYTPIVSNGYGESLVLEFEGTSTCSHGAWSSCSINPRLNARKFRPDGAQLKNVTLRSYTHGSGVSGSCSGSATWTLSKAVPLAFSDRTFGVVEAWNATQSCGGQSPNLPFNQIRFSPLDSDLNVGSWITWNTTSQSDRFDARVTVDGLNNILFAMHNPATAGTVSVARYKQNGAIDIGYFTVVDHGTNQVSQVRVAGFKDGGFVVVWQVAAVDGSGQGVYLQMFDKTGTKVGGSVLVNAATSGDQRLGDVGVFSDNGFVVVYDDQNLDGSSNYGIAAQRFKPDGTKDGSVINVNARTSGNQMYPSVAVLPGDDWVVAFADASSIAWTRKFNRAGVLSPGRPELRVNTATPGEQSAARADITGTGNILVAYLTKATTVSDIMGRVFDSTGKSVKAEFLVNTYTTGAQKEPAVAGGPNRFVVTWTSDGQDGSELGVYSQMYTDMGSSYGAEFRVNGITTGKQQTPSVAMGADGRFLVAWNGATGDMDSDVFGKVYDADGNVLKGDFTINQYTTSFQEKPFVAGVPLSNEFLVGWSSNGQDGSGYGVFVRKISGSGIPISDEQRVNSTWYGDQTNVVLTVSSDGHVVACWDCMGCTADASGTWGVVCQVLRYDDLSFQGNEFMPHAITAGTQQSPAVRFLSSRDFVVAYHTGDLDHSSFAVQYQGYSILGKAVGPRITVNRQWDNAQQTPFIVPLNSDGKFFTGWQSSGQDGSDFGIYMRGPLALQQPTDCSGSGTCSSETLECKKRYVDACSTVYWDTAQSACIAVPKPDKTLCDDGNECTRVDACRNGVCVGEMNACVEERLNVVSWGADTQWQPSVAHVGYGRYVTQFFGVPNNTGKNVMRLTDASGSRENEEISLASDAFQFSSPIAVNARGEFIVLRNGGTSTCSHGSWSSCTINWSIYGRKYSANGSAATGSVAIRNYTNQSGVSGSCSGNSWTDSARAVPLAFSDLSIGLVDAWRSHNSCGGGSPNLAINTVRYKLMDSSFTAGTDISLVAIDEATKFDAVTTTQDKFLVGFVSSNVVHVRRYNKVGQQDLATSVSPGNTVNAVRVASFSDGRFLALWDVTGVDGSGRGVYGQRFLADGTKTEPSFCVNQNIAGDQRLGGVGVFSDDGFVVVFDDQTGDLNDWAVMYRLFTKEGPAASGDVRVNLITAGYQYYPNVAVLDRDRFAVAFTDGADVYTRVFQKDGTPDLGVFESRANQTESGNQVYAAAATASTGLVMTAYESPVVSGNYGTEILARLTTGRGIATAQEFQVNTHEPNNQSMPSVAGGPDRFVVAWSSTGQDGSGEGVYAQRYDGRGVKLGSEFRVANSTVGDQTQPGVAMNADGKLLIAYNAASELPGSISDVLAKVYDKDGNVTKDEFRVNTYTPEVQGHPVVAVSPSDKNFVIAWESTGQDLDGTGIYFRKLAVDGTPMTQEMRVNTTVAAAQQNPSLAVSEDGSRVLICWESYNQDAPTTWGVFCRVIQPKDYGNIASGGPEFTPVAVTSGNQTGPTTVRLSTGDFVVAWATDNVDYGNEAIEYRGYDSLGRPKGIRLVANRYGASSQLAPFLAPLLTDGQFLAGWQSNGQDGSGYGITIRGPLQLRYGGDCEANGSCSPQTQNCIVELADPCSTAYYDTYLMQCVKVPKTDGTPCDDGNSCTLIDSCINGMCIGSLDSCVEERISVSGIASRRPSIASLGFGRYVTQWTGGSGANYMRVSDDLGSRENEETDISSGDSQWTTPIAESRTEPGNFVVMEYENPSSCSWGSWSSCSGTNYLYARKYRHDGALLASKSVATYSYSGTAGGNCSGTVYLNNQKAVPLSFPDGTYGVVEAFSCARTACSSSCSPAEKEIRFTPLISDMTPSSSVVSLATGLTAADYFDAAVTTEGEGKILAAWVTDSTKVYVRRYQQNGQIDHPAATLVADTGSGNDVNAVRVAPFTHGGFLVLWDANNVDGSSRGVFGRRFNGDGTPVDVAFRVNTSTYGDQRLGDVGVFSNNDFIVVYDDAYGDPSGYAVRAQTFTSAGNLLGGEMRINAFVQGNQYLPSVAVLDNDRWAVTFIDGNSIIWTRRYTKDGSPVFGIPERRVNTSIQGAQSYPKAAPASTGKLMVAYESPLAGGTVGSEIAARLFDGYTGVPVSDEFQVNEFDNDLQIRPSVAAGPNRFVVTWDSAGQDGDGNGIVARLYDGDGKALGHEFIVNTVTTGVQKDPSVGMDMNGNFLVAWNGVSASEAPKTDVFGRIFDQNGNQKKADFVLSAGTSDIQAKPFVRAVPGKNEFLVGWESYGQDTSDYGVFLRKFSANGVALTTDIQANTTTGAAQQNIAFDVTADGRVVACWDTYGQDAGNSWGVACQQFNYSDLSRAGTEFLPSAVTSGTQSSPSVAFLSTGDFVVQWITEGTVDTSGFAIQYRGFNRQNGALAPREVVNRYWSSNQYRPFLVSLPKDGLFVSGWQSDGQDGDSGGIYLRGPLRLFTASTCSETGTCVAETLTCISQLSDQCNTAVYDPVAKVCRKVPLKTGVACNDGKACTQTDICINGTCIGSDDACVEERVNYNAVADRLPGITGIQEGRYVVHWTGGANENMFHLSDSVGSRENEDVGVQPGGNATSQWSSPVVSNPAGQFVVLETEGGSSCSFGAWSSCSFSQSLVMKKYQPDGTQNASRSVRSFGATGSAGGNCSATVSTSGMRFVPLIFSDNSYGVAMSWTASISGCTLSSTTVPQKQVDLVTVPADLSSAASAVNLTTGLPSADRYDIAVTKGDRILLVWVDSAQTKIYAKRFQKTGASDWSNAVQLAGPAGNAINIVRLLYNTMDDNFVVLWDESNRDASGRGVFGMRYSSDGSPVGTTFQVNQSTLGDQYLGGAAFFKNYGFVVTFDDQFGDVNQWGPKFRLFNPDASPLTGEVRMNTRMLGSQQFPNVAVLDNDDFVAVWRDNNRIAWTRRYDRNGNPVVGVLEKRANTTTSGAQSNFRAAKATNGNVLVAYESPVFGKDSGEILARVIKPDGTEAKAEFQVNQRDVRLQNAPAVAGGPDRFVVVWDSYGQAGTGSLDDIVARVFTGAGSAVGNEFLVNTTTADGQRMPAVGMAGSGKFLVAWNADVASAGSLSDLFAATFDANGTQVASEFQVNTYTTNHQDRPFVVGSPTSDEFLVAWQSLGQDGNLLGSYIRKFNINGTAMSSETALNTTTTGDQARPVVAISKDGTKVTACWESYGQDASGTWGVYCRILNYADLSQVKAEFSPHAITAGTQQHPTVAYLPNGDLVLGWATEGLDTSGFGVQYRPFSAAGAGQKQRVLANRYWSSDQWKPILIPSNDGTQVMVLWESIGQDGSDAGVYFRVMPL